MGRLVPAVLAVAVLTGCGTRLIPGTPPGEQSSLYSGYEFVLPMDSFTDVASFTQQLTLFRVEGERFSRDVPPGELGGIARFIRPTALRTLWTSGGAAPQPLSEFTVDGVVVEPQDRDIDRNPGRAFLVGRTYLAAFVSSRGVLAPAGGAVWAVDGDDVVLNASSPAYARAAADLDVDALADALRQTRPHDWVRPYLSIDDGFSRLAAAERDGARPA